MNICSLQKKPPPREAGQRLRNTMQYLSAGNAGNLQANEKPAIRWRGHCRPRATYTGAHFLGPVMLFKEESRVIKKAGTRIPSWDCGAWRHNAYRRRLCEKAGTHGKVVRQAHVPAAVEEARLILVPPTTFPTCPFVHQKLAFFNQVGKSCITESKYPAQDWACPDPTRRPMLRS